MNLFKWRHLEIISDLLFSNSSGFGYNAIANFSYANITSVTFETFE